MEVKNEKGDVVGYRYVPQESLMSRLEQLPYETGKEFNLLWRAVTIIAMHIDEKEGL